MSSYAVEAQDLELKGDEGKVFGPLSFAVPSQGLTNLLGKGGSGRTALALVLSGRMKPTGGSLSVLGESKPRPIRSRVAIAGVEQIAIRAFSYCPGHPHRVPVVVKALVHANG